MNFVDYLLDDFKTAPDKNFLAGKEEISYKQLYDKVSILTNFLKENYGGNNKILLCSPNNPFFIITYLSIIKSGNICIPVDPFLSTASLNYILKETSPSIIFYSQESRIDLNLILGYRNFTESLLLNMDNNTEPLTKETEFNPIRMAVIIYTSGSTGRPKGVMLSHKNLISNTNSIITYLNLQEFDRMLIVMPFHYCYGLSLLNTHLKCKGSIVINNSFMFTAGVINDLVNYNCTGFAGVPSHYQVILRKTKKFISTKFPALRYVTQAGGKLHNVFIDEFTSTFSDISFYVMYGQTEATARLSYLPYELLKTKKGSIGKSIPGVTLRVVNENFIDIRPGDVGEIIAKGDNIMLGYYNDETATKKRIIDGWLKTGDLATIDDEGFIYIKARSKEVMKIRGKRINPKEIEDVILKMKEVIDCSVYAVNDEIEGESLETQVLVADQFKNLLTPKDISLHCAKELELYKIPKRIIFKDHLNVGSNGKKIDTKWEAEM